MASRQSPDTPAALEIRALDAGYGARPVLRGLRAGPLREGTLVRFTAKAG